MNDRNLVIKDTNIDDLENVMNLWNNGEVMYYVGFPNGIDTTLEKLRKWIKWAINKPQRCHYSIYDDKLGYCGETFYDVDKKHNLAALDIKLLPIAQGKGIAYQSLSFVIKEAFNVGMAQKVYVDPHLDNKRAWKLYYKLGFISKARPTFLEDGDTYLELNISEFNEIVEKIK